MASDGPGVPPESTEDRREEGIHMTPTSLPDSLVPEAGVPADCDSGKATMKAPGESAEVDENGVNICQFFRMKKCRFGDRCRLSHSDPSPDDSGAVSPDSDDKQDEERMEKQKKKKGNGSKVTKPKYSERREVNKKPRMRTADDVIARILWDSSADASEFVVGYVDRFLGVLERPFCDFNWDTSPCDCDYSAELALPRHRIQYFTYRGHRVWDRHTRTDRVFGSTGQSLAPPFGREEEVDGDKHSGNDEQQQNDLEQGEEQPLAVCGQDDSESEECTHTKNTHLEEEEQDEINIQTTDPTHLESQGPPGVVEEAANRDKASSRKREGEEETLAEAEETRDCNKDCENGLGAPQISQSPSAAVEEMEEKRGGRRPRKRPTHFITFRANTPAILSSFQQLQKEMTTLLPSSAPHWQSASCLHVTMCLLVLRSPAEVTTAVRILTQFAHLDRNPPVALTFPVKLKHFNGRVLYLSPHPQVSLQQLNSGLQEAYMKEGLLHKNSYNPRYHLTLAKVTGQEGERIFGGVGDLRVGKGLNFGRLPINSLHLCVVEGSHVDGFYETVHTVTLR